MRLVIRRETPADFRAVEELTREAFWNHYAPGCCEHYVAHVLRDSEAFLPALDYVAEADGEVVGSIMYTRAEILGDDGAEIPVLCFGPLAVLPAYQGRGIGARLIEETKTAARERGHAAILIMGDPAYYARAGFVPAKTFGIGTGENTYSPALLACELVPGALEDCRGRFREAAVFDVDMGRVEEFDKGFPSKEKKSGGASQERFADLSSISEPRI